MWQRLLNASTMRTIALSLTAAAIGIAFYGIYADKDLYAVSMLCGVFLSTAVAGKVAQKPFEVKKVKQGHSRDK